MREVVRAEEGEVFDIELEADILKANERLAMENKELLRRHGVKAIDVMGAIGSGKTSLIEKMVQALKGRYRMAAFKGDLTTTIDAELIGRHGVEVVAINTGKECHLDANLVRKALQKISLDNLDLLFIENVGNLICPAEFALGEHKRVMLLSLPEGDDKPHKYPLMFTETDVVLINKIDLLPYLDFNVGAFHKVVTGLNPDVTVLQVSCKTGQGLEGWFRWLEEQIKETKSRHGS